jgi:hypothetical protein
MKPNNNMKQRENILPNIGEAAIPMTIPTNPARIAMIVTMLYNIFCPSGLILLIFNLQK